MLRVKLMPITSATRSGMENKRRDEKKETWKEKISQTLQKWWQRDGALWHRYIRTLWILKKRNPVSVFNLCSVITASTVSVSINTAQGWHYNTSSSHFQTNSISRLVYGLYCSLSGTEWYSFVKHYLFGLLSDLSHTGFSVKLRRDDRYRDCWHDHRLHSYIHGLLKNWVEFVLTLTLLT